MTQNLIKISVNVVHPERSSVVQFLTFNQTLLKALNPSNEIMLDRSHLVCLLNEPFPSRICDNKYYLEEFSFNKNKY